jgi:cytochrome c2
MRNVMTKTGLYKFILLLSTVLLLPNLGAQIDRDNGKALFKAQCARCHYVTDKRFVGPGLAGVRDRWKNDDTRLLAWIRNSQDFLKTGDTYANNLFKEWNNSVMPNFNLSDDEILSILAYIEDPAEPGDVVADAAVAASGSATGGGDSGTLLTILLVVGAIVLIILARSLNSVSSALENVRREQSGEPKIEDEKVNYWAKFVSWAYMNKKIVAVLGIVVVGFFAVKGFNALNQIGIYTGYEPEQPIKFSHALHAGQNGIDCQYCHSTVEKSKHANIPSVNICMNCHKAVQEGPQYGRAEITKIYAAAGWDPINNRYFDGYADMDREVVERVFETYLRDNEQAEAYAGVRPFIQRNVEWIQIHKLPDHAFFSHQQHVKVGKVECTTCHGEVEKMEVVYQHSPLTMGWCINCHRETEVQYASNGYYERLHEYYKNNKGSYEMPHGQAFTVEKIGGLECSKCHY